MLYLAQFFETRKRSHIVQAFAMGLEYFVGFDMIW